MINFTLTIDILLATSLLWLAWKVIHSHSLFKSVVFFITLGLILSLSWVRLHAIDIALAEAAIGAGLTGVLLLDAIDHLSSRTSSPPHKKKKALIIAILTGVTCILGISIIGPLLTAPENIEEIPKMVYSQMPQTQISNPSTAVLLSFRAYDTLLEVGVLLVALLGALGLSGGGLEYNQLTRTSHHPVLRQLSMTLAPVLILTGGYLLWAGTHQPGGAFQAGATWGVCGVLLCKSKFIDPLRWPTKRSLTLISLGLAVFLTIGAGAIFYDLKFLEYPTNYSYQIIFAIETAVALSTAITLVMLYALGRALLSPQERPEFKHERSGK